MDLNMAISICNFL